MAALLVLLALVVVAGATMVGYNGMVRARNRNREAWSQIDVELERRHDLIPNLVETVKGYAAHEQGTLEAVTAARAGAVQAHSSGDPTVIGPAENALTGTLRSLFAVAENYPQLRAVESFRQLQEQLTATEDKLEFARHFYNTSARDYNTAIQTFPRTLIASAFSFERVGYYAADQGAVEVPQVRFAEAAAGRVSAPHSSPGSTPSGPPSA